MSFLISSTLNLRFVRTPRAFHLSSISFNVPNMISRYTPDLPKQMKRVLTFPSSFLPLYRYSRLSLCVYRLFTTILPHWRSRFQYLNESF